MADLFKDKANDWDKGDVRNQTAKTIATSIKNEITLTKNMQILDFGVGTGLLGFDIALHVKKVYGVDISPKMIEKLIAKNTPELNITTFCQDIIQNPLDLIFDGLISSMTLHHVEYLDSFFTTIYKNIKDDGFIAIADLETEDGTFHSDNTGVFHFGFEADELIKTVKKAGFRDVYIKNINTINKQTKDFGVFLLTAKK